MGRRGFGYVRRLPSRRYQASYTGPDHQRHNAHSTFARKGDAEAWLSTEERLIDEGRWTPPEHRNPNHRAATPITVEEYCRANIKRRSERARRPLKPSTVGTYLQSLRLTVFPELGDLPLSALTEERVQRWHNELPDRPTQNGNAYNLLRSILADAADEGLIEANPVRIKGAGKPEPKRKGKALTAAVLAAYIAAADDHYRVPLALAAWCSLRSGEVRGLRRCDVSNDGAWLHVQQGVTRVGVETEDGREGERWHFGTPKSAAGIRPIAVPPVVSGDLADVLATHDAHRGPNDLLFPARDGTSPISDSTFRKAHNRALKRIGHSGFTLHDLRRTGATLAGQSGATTKEIMRRLGHTRPDVAMLYQVADNERDRAIADRMAAAALDPPPEPQ